MMRSRWMTVLPLLWVTMGTSTAVEAQGLNPDPAQNDPLDGQVTIREQDAGVSRIDYTRCVKFCASTFEAASLERNTCIAGCSRIDSSFQEEGILLGPSSEDSFLED
ncbi:hypothetical protein [Nitrosococcus wardiae]|uniref:Uncharacterized protein n=1 Tax=Nitrosococcus wardiae TaxID=1814290 RepID=A0A4P7BZJ8_9GAMM|nr:hypothetical protein [Nitrosococcus wardiae]QBQ54787.1 hypothetical protein E3U44_09920 [Nitrosococcus wardiae]